MAVVRKRTCQPIECADPGDRIAKPIGRPRPDVAHSGEKTELIEIIESPCAAGKGLHRIGRIGSRNDEEIGDEWQPAGCELLHFARERLDTRSPWKC